MTETLNNAIILTSFAPLATVFNFIALAVIADFDNFVFESMSNEYFKKLLEEEVVERNFRIEHTTSKRCPKDDLSKMEDSDGN